MKFNNPNLQQVRFQRVYGNNAITDELGFPKYSLTHFYDAKNPRRKTLCSWRLDSVHNKDFETYPLVRSLFCQACWRKAGLDDD